MRFIFINLLCLVLKLSAHSQTKTLSLFRTTSSRGDTSFYLTIQKSLKGISFVFPEEDGETYYNYTTDSTFEKHYSSSTQLVFGPYKFKKVKEKILFQDKNISSRYRDLYEISTTEHFSPDLFASSTDSYTIVNILLDSNALLKIGATTVPCFKFFQTLSGHNSVLDKFYRVIYVDKVNFLPCRTETYSDKSRNQLEEVVFMKNYLPL